MPAEEGQGQARLSQERVTGSQRAEEAGAQPQVCHPGAEGSRAGAAAIRDGLFARSRGWQRAAALHRLFQAEASCLA